jgi:hypothetical protein
MEEHETSLLVASVLALGVGPILYYLARRWRTATWALNAAIVVAVAGLVVLHVLPECVEMAGPMVLLAAAIGLVGPILLERLSGRLAGAGNNLRRAGILLAVFAFIAHEMMDGMALIDVDAVHGHAHDHGDEHLLGLAVILHRIPVGAALFWLLGGAKRWLAWGALGVSACATIAGSAIAGALLPLLDGALVGFAQAFFGGVLLHVLAHRFEALPLRAESDA